MPILNWISDEQLKESVRHLLQTATDAQKKVEADLGKNVIDPFSAMFSMAGFQIDHQTWLKTESTRQAQKTLQNHIGDFHQKILGLVDNWQNLGVGSVIDLVSNENKIIAEVKNKYNTVSGGKLADLYKTLDDLVMAKASKYKDFTAYYVAIIPKNKTRFNREFTPSNKEKGQKCAANSKIREIDGASFYDLVTNEKDALSNLFNVLPEIIKEHRPDYHLDNTDELRRYFDVAFGTSPKEKPDQGTLF